MTTARFATLMMLGLAGSASAQCDPSWDTTLGNPGITSGYIQPMTEWDDGTGAKLYVGGSAVDYGGLAAIDYLGVYNPADGTWSRPGLGIGQGSTNAFLTKMLPWDDGDGEKLYVIGQFNFAGGSDAGNSFARWDGTDWEGVGAGFTQATVRASYDLLPADIGDGERLYVCGSQWGTIGGVTANGLASFDGATFHQWGNGLGVQGTFNPFAAAMADWDDGSGRAIYVCGRFDSVDGVAARNVARFNVASGQWESFGQSLVPVSSLQNMTTFEIFDDGTGPALYVAGTGFRINGGGPIYLAAKWDGTSWTGIGQTVSGRITDLEVFDDGNGPALYASGTAFFEVGYFAKLEAGLWQPVLGSGVNNPPVNGNFASAFGLYAWGDQLLVGGNFTQVGGQDPSTGVGSGTPLPARGLAAVVACSDACTGDFADDFGNLGGDGMVSFGDFLALLGLIGPCPGGTPGCPGDIADDFGNLGGDGMVSFGDFLALLGLIGPCP